MLTVNGRHGASGTVPRYVVGEVCPRTFERHSARRRFSDCLARAAVPSGIEECLLGLRNDNVLPPAVEERP